MGAEPAHASLMELLLIRVAPSCYVGDSAFWLSASQVLFG